MFHKVIQKITLAQLFLRHGVFAVSYCDIAAFLWNFRTVLVK